MDQRQGVELLALGKFFGMTSDPRFQQNQERMRMLSEEAFIYEGQAEIIQREVTVRKARGSSRGGHRDTGLQPRLF
jgi:hypothetical protein